MTAEPSVQDVLDAAHHAIRHTFLSRADVETSTPEQIVWITTSRIAANLVDAASLDWGMRPTSQALVSKIQGAIAGSTMSEAAKRQARRVITETETGWLS